MKYALLFLLLVCISSAYGQVPAPQIKGISKTDVRCNGGADGTITVIATDGRPPYSFSNNGGLTFQSSDIFTNLKAGGYPIVIRDSFNQQSDSQIVNITEPSKLSPLCSGSIQCGGDSSGTVRVDVSGGTQPYTFLWNIGPQRTSPVQTGLSAGIYVVTVTDSNQCKDTCSVRLIQQGSSQPKFKVGDSMSCGYVFYVDPVSDTAHPCATHYLICSYTDQSNRITWYNDQFTYTVTGATTDILFDMANATKIDSFSLAANTCSGFTIDSCSGWYLPSKTELDSMYANLAAKNIGGFAKEGYWSSVEGTKRHSSWIVDFLNGREIQNDKSNKYHIRAVCEVWINN